MALTFTTLKDAVRGAFPERADIAALDFNGTDAQAWQTYARMLEMQPQGLAHALAPLFGVEVAGTMDPSRIDAAVLGLVPYNFCQKNTVLAIGQRDGQVEVATARPYDHDLEERLAFLIGKPIVWRLAPPEAIEDAMLAAYSRQAVQAVHGDREIPVTLKENPIVKLARELMSRAVRMRASDLHFQPYIGTVVARVRVDGALRRLTVLPETVAAMLIRHIKARGGMDPSNTQIPQDGRMSLVVDGRDFELRLSILPASRGERLVIRFLAQSQVHQLAKAGFSLAAMQTIRRAANRPSGLIIFTGPTGSGKTSTLYGMLAEVNRSDVNIITVENPVEYRITGISQVEVNEKAGRGFGAALRSILRQDPDIVLIGEIRDHETAEIAVQAAMTGHLVLTTLHTNDAMTAIPRLLDLGVQPSVLADALVVVAAQRLCRKLCEHCRIPAIEPYAPDEKAFLELTRNAPAYRAVGCDQCDFSGFRGRLPIVDIAEINRTLRDAIAAGESSLTKLESLREGGLKSLAASGSLRIISGETTVREVAHAVGPSFWGELANHYGTYYSTEVAESIPLNAAQGFGVLLLGYDADLAEQLREALAGDGLRLVVASTPEAVNEILHRDEDIAFIVGDVPEDMNLEAAAQLMHEARTIIAWARLPAAVLLPQALLGSEEALRQSGAMAAMFPKPLDPHALVAHIRRTQAR